MFYINKNILLHKWRYSKDIFIYTYCNFVYAYHNLNLVVVRSEKLYLKAVCLRWCSVQLLRECTLQTFQSLSMYPVSLLLPTVP